MKKVRFPRVGRSPGEQPAPLIDMGNPMRMIGHTAFVPFAGGGRCCKCKLLFATLLQNSMCAGCAGNEDEPPVGPLGPLVGKPR
jgi:hypothetical protein